VVEVKQKEEAATRSTFCGAHAVLAFAKLKLFCQNNGSWKASKRNEPLIGR